ncbi:MAG: hypothetical protein ACI4CT_07675 [Lachnospiraceae bacterium]
MIRSYLLSLKLIVSSYTKWAKQLKVNPLHAILSGFEFGDTLGIGTFADFFYRLWDSKDDFTIGKDGIPVCMADRKMNRNGVKKSKHRIKFRCSLASRKHDCNCSNSCFDSKYGRTLILR